MTLARICCRDVDTATPHETVRAAAQRMDSRCVGSLIVVDGDGRAAGILTDRDIAMRVVGAGLDPLETRVGDVMTDVVHTAFESMPIEDALGLMRTEAVRRLVVVRPDGKVVGIVALDDILTLLSEELRDIGDLLGKENPRHALATP